VVDHSTPFSSLPPAAEALLPAEKCLMVLNKCDLPPHPECDPPTVLPRALVSATAGAGLDAVRQWIRSSIESRVALPDPDAITVSARHAAALRGTRDALQRARGCLAQGGPAELAATELHMAVDALGEIVGRIDNERILDALFATFCIGK
jgi:tRNA modification GTPase